MNSNLYTAIGFMSGTSMDGIDASLIQSDGVNKFITIMDEYYKFDDKLFKKLVKLRNFISCKDDLVNYSKDLIELDRDLTFFYKTISEKF